jgi:AcrR family transcriptional regulator
VSSATRSYGGRTADERAAERRRAFLAAARRIWGERGLPALSVRGVCAEAGLADRYFYAEFGNLEELCVAVAQQVGVQLYQAMITAGAKGTTPLDRLRCGLQGFLESIVDDPAIMHIFSSADSASASLAVVRSNAQRDIAIAIARAVDPDHPVDEKSQKYMAAYFCVGGVTLLIEQWLRDPQRTTPQRLATKAVTLCAPVLSVTA